MSVSTRTAQQPLGLGQIGAMLVVIALAIAVAGAVALGSLASKQAESVPAAKGAAPPAFIDHGSRGEMNNVVPSKNGFFQPDGRGGIEFVPSAPKALPGLGGDPGFAPRSRADDGDILGKESIPNDGNYVRHPRTRGNRAQ
jgi:hypothetical protein